MITRAPADWQINHWIIAMQFGVDVDVFVEVFFSGFSYPKNYTSAVQLPL